MARPPAVLFVCLANICRSPTAEAVLRKRAEAAGLDVHIDSAGIAGAHRGEAPDGRSRLAGEMRGYDFLGQESRRITKADFTDFDFILAMDKRNLATLLSRCPEEFTNKLALFMDYAPAGEVAEVPDPYRGGSAGFDKVLDMIEAASDGLITALK